MDLFSELLFKPLAEILNGISRILLGGEALFVFWVFVGIPLWILWCGLKTRTWKGVLFGLVFALAASSPLFLFVLAKPAHPDQKKSRTHHVQPKPDDPDEES